MKAGGGAQVVAFILALQRVMPGARSFLHVQMEESGKGGSAMPHASYLEMILRR